MTTEELGTWFLDQPLLMTYLGVLLMGSLVSFIVLLRKITRSRRLGQNPIPPWPLANLDFALFMVFLVLWFILSGSVIIHIFRWIAGDNAVPGINVMILGGFLLQAGMLYLFLRFKFHYRNPNEGPVSPCIIPLGQSLLLGLFYFLASLPVVYGVGAVWTGLLEFLRRQGFEINLPLQDAVLLFRETDSYVSFLGLLLLAIVVAPVVEEIVFRGGIFRFFKGKTSLAVALFISGIVFGLIHGNLHSLPGLVTVGICLGLSYELSGNIRVPIFFHAFFNLNSVLWILLLPDNLPT